MVFFKRVLFLAALAVGFFGFNAYASATSAWQYVGADHFTAGTITGITTADPQIALGPDGALYAAFTNDNVDKKVNVMKYSGSAWEYLGDRNFSGASTGALSMAIDATGTVYVAYINTASSSRASVMKYTGSSWTAVGDTTFSTSSIEGITLAIDPYGTPYVAFIASNGDSLPMVLKYASGAWATVGTPYEMRGGAPSMVFSSTGTPYMAVSDVSSGVPTVIKYSGGGWHLVGDLSSINLSGNNPLAISSDDTLYMTVADVNFGTIIKTFAYTGGSWNQVGSDYVADNNGNFKLIVSPGGTLYVSLLDSATTKPTVITYNGSTWSVVGTANFTPTSIQGGIVRLVANERNVPYMAYSDFADFAYTVSVMGYLPAPRQIAPLQTALSTANVSLSWNNPDNGDFTPVTSYKIQRQVVAGGGGFTTLATVSSTVTSYVDSGLSPGVYNYRVYASNSVGDGAVSAEHNITVPPPVYGAAFVPVTPSAKGSGGEPLGFTINNGATAVTSPTVTLTLNADPQTVRWYAVSLDPTFAKDSLIKFEDGNVNFSLPNKFGTYTIYLKYFSTTGVASPVISKTITYKNSGGAATQNSVGKSTLFTRVLKVGSVGADVKALQQFLNAHGFIITATGVGSPGRETSYFGFLTAAAVSRFQEANAARILVPNGFKKGTGMFGQSTMKLISEMK